MRIMTDNEALNICVPARKALSNAINAIREADGEFLKLKAIQEGAKALAPFVEHDAIDHLHNVAVNVHGLDPNVVTAMIAKGIALAEDDVVDRSGFTDEALALRFADERRQDFRYVSAWGKWLHWDGHCWGLDDTLLAFDEARKICRVAAAECNKPKLKTILASAKTVAAVERLPRSDRRLAATTDQWDADPWLLNTPEVRSTCGMERCGHPGQ
jgi:hypothetical protein